MNRGSLPHLGLIIVLCVLGGPPAAQPTRVEGASDAATLFRDRLAAYQQLRREIVASLVENGVDPNAEDGGREFRRLLGLAIRDARGHAQPGEIFCAGVAGHMRQLVWNTLLGQDDLLSEVPDPASVRVNDFYPEGEPPPRCRRRSFNSSIRCRRRFSTVFWRPH